MTIHRLFPQAVQWTLLAVLALAIPTATLAKDETDTERAKDKEAIGQRSKAFLNSLAKGDARQVAAFWTSTGEYTHGDNVTIRGRDNIQKAYAEHFKSRKKDGTVVVQNGSIRFLAADTAIQEGTFLVKRSNPSENSYNEFSILYVREKGEWQFAQLREVPSGASLRELEWLVGTWAFKTKEGEGTMTFEWSPKKTYLLGRTSVKQQEETTTATQILALDPATKGIKSWTFESDGSIGTASWVRTTKGWLAKSVAVNADGEKVRSVITLTSTDADMIEWQSTERTIDGEKAPDIGPIKAVREEKK